ncbi:MAG: ATP-binding protein [Saprospiraceae bacterium]|nr:ATP-binding protein [Saprospiraceae bacterium]
MRLRYQYIIFIVLIHLVALVLSFYILKDYKLLFIASEAIVLLSLFFSIRLYNGLVKPLNLLLEGAEAIKDRDFNVKFLKTGKFEMDQLIEVYNNMIDELRNERLFQKEQHYFLEKLIQSSPIGIIILDFDFKIAQINPVAQSLLQIGNKPTLPLPLNQIQHPLAKELLRLLQNEQTDAITIHLDGIRSFKCQKSHFMDRGFHRHFIMIEELTADLLRTEKQAYGKVIRMMAHEVNNSVGPINSILDSLAFFHQQSEGDQANTYAKAIEVAKQRNQRLNKFMRNFADVVRLPELEKTTQDLRDSLNSIHLLYRAEAESRQISINLKLPSTPVQLSYDVHQIDQAFVNILKNALESIQEKGIIQIQLDDNKRELIIADNGPGIPEELAQQLFRPFFSSKPTGQGIGLTITKEILYRHRFVFSLSTEEDGWTRFRIRY